MLVYTHSFSYRSLSHAACTHSCPCSGRQRNNTWQWLWWKIIYSTPFYLETLEICLRKESCQFCAFKSLCNFHLISSITFWKQKIKCSYCQLLIWLWFRNDGLFSPTLKWFTAVQNFSLKTLKLIDIFLSTGVHTLRLQQLSLWSLLMHRKMKSCQWHHPAYPVNHEFWRAGQDIGKTEIKVWWSLWHLPTTHSGFPRTLGKEKYCWKSISS